MRNLDLHPEVPLDAAIAAAGTVASRATAPTTAGTGARASMRRGHACGSASASTHRGSFLETVRDQRGGMTVAVAGAMAMTLTMAGVVVDGGNLLVTHRELHTVADLAAKSAASELARVYLDSGRLDPVADCLSAEEKARVAAAADARGRRNMAGGRSIRVDASDVRFGKWDDATGAFVETDFGPEAVIVTARRDEVANGPVALFFAGLFDRDDVPLSATSSARVSGVRYLPPGAADFPVAIASAWYDHHPNPCSHDNEITFYPTGSARGCAGWHTFEQKPASAAALKSILRGLRNGTWKSPAINADSSVFEFTGGTVSSAVRELTELYNAKKNAFGEMPVLIPVYDRDDCSNPNGPIRIIGVARAVITEVTAPGDGDLVVKAKVQCEVVRDAESGGRDFGVLAAGPDLVK